MSEKKNIDHLFKDKLEHFEVAPPDISWKNIEAKLNEKQEKRRVIPFWWKLGGVAAIFLLGLGLYSLYFDTPISTENPIVSQDSIKNSTNNNGNKNDIVIHETDTTHSDNNSGTHPKTKNDSDDKLVNADPDEKTNTAAGSLNEKTNKAVVTVSDKSEKTISNKRKTNLKAPIQKNTSIAENESITNSNRNSQKANRNKSNTANPASLNSGIAANEKQQKSNTIKQKIGSSTNSSVAANEKQIKNPESNSNKNIPNGIEKEKEKNPIINLNSKSDLAVKTKESEAIKKMDSTKLAVVEPNALEELQNEKEKKLTKEQKINRWQVTPNVAPIYFSSLSNGSPLDEKLEENQKVYGTNFSYGVAVNYEVNKKYSIRTGVHSYTVDYDTKDIIYYQDMNASKMQNVDPTSQGALIQIEPFTHVHNVDASFGRMLGEKYEGVLNQKTSYIEVPFEVTYKLMSDRFGVDLIGGVSTMFLNQNDVYLKGSDFTMKIGEASNLNKMHFSTNIGLGFKYNFLKRFDARIEPLFKYQINTYSTGAGNFKPYVFGIYSGISYRF